MQLLVILIQEVDRPEILEEELPLTRRLDRYHEKKQRMKKPAETGE